VPDFIVGLLNNVGTHINPIRLISEIPVGLPIPRLRDALVKILQDYNLQVCMYVCMCVCVCVCE
jgi:vacuolar protein sorting-associated protein 41